MFACIKMYFHDNAKLKCRKIYLYRENIYFYLCCDIFVKHICYFSLPLSLIYIIYLI